jgi:hypothetical protein
LFLAILQLADKSGLSESLVNYIQSVSSAFATDQILFPWGGDFDHAIAQWDFYNMDQVGWMD